MTDDEHKMIAEIQQKNSEVHDWLFKPPLEGKPSRAMQLDDVMSGIRAGKWLFRAMLYLAGAISVFTAAYGAVQGWFAGGAGK